MFDLSLLSPAQQRVVAAGDGPLLVVAGPGSGKTTVLAARIAFLLAHRGLSPASVLAITFTTAAARELRSRLGDVLGPPGRDVDVCTFHALGLRIVRQWSEVLGYGSDPPAVYGREDARALLREAVAMVGGDVERWPLASLAGALEAHRLRGSHLGDHARQPWPHPEPGRTPTPAPSPELAALLPTLVRAYDTLLQRRQAVDYPAMLLLPLRLFREHPPALRLCQDAYRQIACDEGQDVCQPQYTLLRLLAERHRNVMLVADPRQSIFGWRGADTRLLNVFRRDFPESRVLTLDENFRSTGQIVAVANVFSAALGYGGRLRTGNPPGPAPLLCAAPDETAEAAFVAAQIERLCDQGLVRAPADVAVLYRSRHQADEIALALRARGLAYQVRGGGDLFTRPEVQHVLAYLRLAIQPGDAAALARIVNVPPRRLGRLARALVDEPARLEELVRRAQPYGPAAVTSAAVLSAFLTELHTAGHHLSPAALLDSVLAQTGYGTWLARQPDGAARLANLARLRAAAERAESDLASWLAELHVEDAIDLAPDDQERVQLTTVHAAKGGQWQVVFLVGFEEGLLPHARALGADEPASRRALDEELRVAFVAVTRPRTHLCFSYCRSRHRQQRLLPRRPSRFLAALPEGLLERAPSRYA